jgi:biotin transport system substrate-specific component
VYAAGFRLRQGQVVAQNVALVTLFTALTAIGAQVAVRLPFSPVPMTLQVFVVILSGLALGSRRGLMSQLAYLAAGAAGLPVFSQGSGSVLVFLGPTAGYLWAFPAAAWTAGWLRERLARWQDAGALLAGLAAVVVIHAGGYAWLLVWPGLDATPIQAWILGVAPFVAIDVAKAAGAMVVSGAIRRAPARTPQR